MDYNRRSTNARPLAGATPDLIDRDTAIAYFDALPKELRVLLADAVVPISAKHVYLNLAAGYPVKTVERAITAQDEINRRRWREEATEAVQCAGNVLRRIR